MQEKESNIELSSSLRSDQNINNVTLQSGPKLIVSRAVSVKATMAAKATGHALFDLTGKTALVTGASSGLGRAMATALATSGCHVILAARRVEKLQDATRDIQQLTRRENAVSYLPADLSSLQGVKQLADAALSPSSDTLSSSPDILINAAGVNMRQPSTDVTPESWEQTLFLNLTVPFFLARHLVPSMKEKRWGRIINIASLQSVRAFPNSMPYGASKGGVAQLTRAMAEEWSQDGICCNAIAPGFFPTELTATLFEDTSKSRALAQQTAMGRNGLLEDIYGPTIFLSSPASNYVTVSRVKDTLKESRSCSIASYHLSSMCTVVGYVDRDKFFSWMVDLVPNRYEYL